MKVEMLMPQMGESITEATISKWVKGVGQTVKKDEMILEISTDKVDSEIPAPAAGTIVEIKANQGDVVPVKSVIAIIDTEGGSAVASSSANEPKPAPTPTHATTTPVTPAPTATSHASSTNNSHQSSTSQNDDDRFFSPLVKSLAEKHGIPLSELSSLPGSGQGGRFTKEDFMAYLDRRSGNTVAQVQSSPQPAPTPAPQVAKPASAPQASSSSPSATGEWRADGTKLVPMDNMRKAIAEHMVRSKHTSPHVYSIQEIDMTNVSKWRAQHKNAFKSKEGFNLSFTPFFLEATVKALQEFPYINASVEGNTIVLKRNINLGCAVALGSTGLIVPVIKRAEEKNFVGIARGLDDLASRARNKKLLPDDVAGGTFTVTNPGVFGTMIGTPIINQPQVAILCLGAIEKRPVVVDDMIAIRERCYLTLSYDHRIVDGSMGGLFLKYIKDYLEGWDLDRAL
jgi:2-oxoglutarate dehydrogenase E2 component (dihydrolipoamide succinyltransferase)